MQTNVSELLNNALENGILNISEVEAKVNNMADKKILEAHKYAISQKKNGSWIEYKAVHTRSTSYIARINADWKRFYLKDEKGLIDRPLNELDKIELEQWVHVLIKEFALTKKVYNNMALILRECLEYAYDKHLIPANPFLNVTINKKLFSSRKKKTGHTQVYTNEEMENLCRHMVQKFHKDESKTAPLAILLNFELGLRIGELMAIRFSDIEGQEIFICRQEVRVYALDGEKSKLSHFEVVDHTKTDMGERKIYLTKRAREILDLIKTTNEKYGHACEDYVFCFGENRLNQNAVHARIQRGCERIGMMHKSSHKIRKTFVSTLIDANISIDEIRNIVGHADTRVTFESYCFNRSTPEETNRHLEQALSQNKPTLSQLELVH